MSVLRFSALKNNLLTMAKSVATITSAKGFPVDPLFTPELTRSVQEFLDEGERNGEKTGVMEQVQALCLEAGVACPGEFRADQVEK